MQGKSKSVAKKPQIGAPIAWAMLTNRTKITGSQHFTKNQRLRWVEAGARPGHEASVGIAAATDLSVPSKQAPTRSRAWKPS